MNLGFWFPFRPLSYSQEPIPFSNVSAFSLLHMISQSLGACWHFWIQGFSCSCRHRMEIFFLYSTYARECEAGVKILNAFAKVDVFPLGSHRGCTLPNMELFASGNGGWRGGGGEGRQASCICWSHLAASELGHRTISLPDQAFRYLNPYSLEILNLECQLLGWCWPNKSAVQKGFGFWVQPANTNQ